MQGWHRKAPQLIAAGIIIAIVLVLLLDYLEDVLIEGAPITSGPLGAILSAIVFFVKNVTATVSSWGYVGVFVLMLLESSSLPIPSEVVLPFAGYLVFLRQLNLWAVLSVATAAGIGGCLIDYYVGMKAAHAMSQHRILGRVFFTRSQLEVAGRWFVKYGASVVFFSRLIPGFRTIVSFPAGAARMPLAKFITYTTAGCLVWSGVLIYVGYFLGSDWTEVAGVSRYLIVVSVIAVVVGFTVLLLRRQRKARGKQLQAGSS
jgi:membrane protein DedA with SNARE-associated domain